MQEAPEFSYVPPTMTAVESLPAPPGYARRATQAEAWVLAALLAVVGLPLLYGFATLPAESLRTSLDGATMERDAAVAAFVGALELGVALLVLLRGSGRASGRLLAWTCGGAAAMALFLGVVLVRGAEAMATAEVFDSETTVPGVFLVGGPFVIGLAVLVGAIALRRGWSVPKAAAVGFGTLLGSLGAATLGFAGWTWAHAPGLRASALARVHDVRQAPGPGLLVALAAVALAALLLRRRGSR